MGVYKGWNAKIKVDDTPIGYCTEVRFSIDESLEAYFEAGNRVMAKIIEGPINITGTITRAYVDTTLLLMLNETEELDYFDLEVDVPGVGTLTLTNCKLGKGTINIPQDGFLIGTYDFTAISFVCS